MDSAEDGTEEHGRHCKSLEVRRRQRYCVSRSSEPLGNTRDGLANPAGVDRWNGFSKLHS
jgi:hypothetical protein